MRGGIKIDFSFCSFVFNRQLLTSSCSAICKLQHLWVEYVGWVASEFIKSQPRSTSEFIKFQPRSTNITKSQFSDSTLFSINFQFSVNIKNNHSW